MVMRETYRRERHSHSLVGGKREFKTGKRSDRHLYQAEGEESALKREVYHWSFVLPQKEENTFVEV